MVFCLRTEGSKGSLLSELNFFWDFIAIGVMLSCLSTITIKSYASFALLLYSDIKETMSTKQCTAYRLHTAYGYAKSSQTSDMRLNIIVF